MKNTNANHEKKQTSKEYEQWKD